MVITRRCCSDRTETTAPATMIERPEATTTTITITVTDAT
jgi:hypothetical protein